MQVTGNASGGSGVFFSLALLQGIHQGISSRRPDLDLEGLLLPAVLHFQLEPRDERRNAGMDLEALKLKKCSLVCIDEQTFEAFK